MVQNIDSLVDSRLESTTFERKYAQVSLVTQLRKHSRPVMLSTVMLGSVLAQLR